jgi:hypothetical protein
MWWYPFLEKAAPEDRATIELMYQGVWWPVMDEGVSVKGLLLGWKAPGARDPSITQPDIPLALSIGEPMPPDWETRDECLVEGACCAVDDADYRSLIHKRVHDSYGFGRRYNPNFDYDRFFAATDTLLDVGNILHVAKIGRWPASETVGQLWMYGVLQALVVQQDATFQLMQCFGIAKEKDVQVDLNEVRDLRTATSGHPSSHVHENNRIKGCTYLSHRDHASRTKFHVVTLRDFNKAVHRSFDLLELIPKQRKALDAYLQRVWCAVKDDEAFCVPD